MCRRCTHAKDALHALRRDSRHPVGAKIVLMMFELGLLAGQTFSGPVSFGNADCDWMSETNRLHL